jgi:hypothetical protein
VLALARLLRSGGVVFPAGREMHGWAREAGFSREKMMVGAGATVYSTREEREWWGKILVGRFMEDENYRARTLESGTSVEEIAVIVRDLEVWMREVDGWYGLLQAENIYRK